MTARPMLRTGNTCVAVALSAASLAPPSGLAAQEPEQDTTVFRVTANLRDADTNEALLGALIEVTGHPGRYVTGMHGQVGFDLPAGHYTFTAHKGGYATLRGDFRVVRAGNLMVMMHELGEVDTSIPGRLLVRVAEFGSGRLIEGAAVSLSGGQARMTDGQGWVEFRNLSRPVAEVTVASFGYETRTERISLQDQRTTAVEVSLAIDAVVLAPLEVEARSRFLEKQGVYWRLDRGWPDKLLTREELIEQSEPYLSDVFRHLAGFQVIRTGYSATLATYSGCPIPVFLDGRPVGLAGLNMNDIQAEELEFAEVYDPGRVPGRYLRAADFREPHHICGIVLLWSRRRAGKR